MRIAASDPKVEGLLYLAKQIASLVTAGPPGTTGYTSGRPKPRPQFGFWPCLIERKNVNLRSEILCI
jgi:hypothetical protein